jgi:predicted DNA-binding antitoxin AbrB/MazE fold protein
MARTITAVYENGVFRPLQPVDLAEGQRVQVEMPSPAAGGPISAEEAEQIMRRLERVGEGLSDEEIAVIEAAINSGRPQED